MRTRAFFAQLRIDPGEHLVGFEFPRCDLAVADDHTLEPVGIEHLENEMVGFHDLAPVSDLTSGFCIKW